MPASARSLAASPRAHIRSRAQLLEYLRQIESDVLSTEARLIARLRASELHFKTYQIQKSALREVIDQLEAAEPKAIENRLEQLARPMEQAATALRAALRDDDRGIPLVRAFRTMVELVAVATDED
jgi:hypothetical protein